jgi:hypothetical protein
VDINKFNNKNKRRNIITAISGNKTQRNGSLNWIHLAMDRVKQALL